MSCSSSSGAPTAPNHASSTTTWHVEHAITPLHAHSTYSARVRAPSPSPCRATSVSDMPSSASTSNALAAELAPGGTTRNVTRRLPCVRAELLLQATNAHTHRMHARRE